MDVLTNDLKKDIGKRARHVILGVKGTITGIYLSMNEVDKYEFLPDGAIGKPDDYLYIPCSFFVSI
jgi:hypothetical protein